MELYKLKEKLSAYVGTQSVVKLVRKLQGDQLFNGCVMGVGRDWLLLYQFHDFSAAGYVALRWRDVKRFRYARTERFYQQMLESEGLVAKAQPQDLPLDDAASLLRALQERKENVIIECEDAPEDVQEFSIGQILLVDDDKLYFAHFDGMGRWMKKPQTIPLEEITSIEFETPYIQTFTKYLTAPCPHLRKHEA
jgi:hypothetical protein